MACFLGLLRLNDKAESVILYIIGEKGPLPIERRIMEFHRTLWLGNGAIFLGSRREFEPGDERVLLGRTVFGGSTVTEPRNKRVFTRAFVDGSCFQTPNSSQQFVIRLAGTSELLLAVQFAWTPELWFVVRLAGTPELMLVIQFAWTPEMWLVV